MSTGVQSSVVLDRAPTPEMLDVFGNLFGRTVTVTNLNDGRVHVSCFSPVEPMHADLGAALRSAANQLRDDLAGLRQP
jgi:ferredoxin-fold anticodon binding domain-containing protein